RPGRAAVRAGPGPVHTAPDRGGVRGGEGGSRAGAVRGAELGGLAPPDDVVVLGAVVSDPGADSGRGENPGRDGVAGAGDLHPPVAVPGPEPRADRGGRHPRVVAEGGGADLQMAQGDRRVPTPLL